MKPKHLLFLFFMSLYACGQDEERIYSCDKNINKWVNSHIAEIHNMNRSDWLKTNQSIGRAVYNAFTAEQKFSFWKEKFQELKKVPWKGDELLHIEKAEKFIFSHRDIFTDKKLTDDQLDVLESFFYSWMKEAEETLGWNKSMCIAIAGTGNMVLNREGDLQALPDNSGGKMLSASTESNCNCNTGITSDFCGVAGPGGCEDTNCDGSDFGCGWIWLQDCNGTCPL